jgi:hypothetical protein
LLLSVGLNDTARIGRSDGPPPTRARCLRLWRQPTSCGDEIRNERFRSWAHSSG